MWRLFGALLASALSTGCEVPAEPPTDMGQVTLSFPIDDLVRGGRYRVRDIVDGDTVTLDTGKDVRMVGTQAPKLPLGRKGFEAWPLSDAARDCLLRLADGQDVTLYYGGLEEDRYGRWLAHLVRADGLWLQGAMLEAGYARVYTFPDNRSAIDAMLAAEAVARRAKKGIWNHPFYAIRSPKDLETAPETFEDTYQIVRGRVESTGAAGGRIFVNFGGDWNTDFTAVIQRSAVRKFTDAPQFNRDKLDGALIEVRGWIERNQGPSVDVTHPEQIAYIRESE